MKLLPKLKWQYGVFHLQYFNFTAFLNFLIWYIDSAEYTFFFSNFCVSFACHAFRERKNGKFSFIGQTLDVRWYTQHLIYILFKLFKA